MRRRGRDGHDLAALASLYFSRASGRLSAAPSPRRPPPREVPSLSAPAPHEPAPREDPEPERLLVLGCPAGPRSYRVAVSLVVQLVREGHRAGLIALGEVGDDPLPVPRLRIPEGAWPGAAPRLDGRGLRLLRRGLRTMDSMVVHAAGADGPLQRVLALGVRRAVVVPGPPEGGTAHRVHEALRGCLEGSHHLRVAVVGAVPLPFRGERRVFALSDPETRRGGLPTEWGDWLGRSPGEPRPVLDRPCRAVRLLA